MKKLLYLHFIFLSIALSQIPPSNFSTITSIGPLGGQISLIRGSSDDAVILVATNRDLLFRSVDGGETWKNVLLPASNTIGRVQVNDIAFHPLDNNKIFITTNAGLFRSSDKGLNWISGKPTDIQPKNSILFVPSNPNIIFGADDAGVLKSTDGGNTWNPLKDNVYFGNKKVIKLAIHPYDNDTTKFFRIFAVTTNNDETKILWSTNGGINWKTFTRGFNSLGLYSTSISKLVVDTVGLGKNAFRVFAGTSDGGIFLQSVDTLWNKIKSNDTEFLGDYISDGDIIYDSLVTPIPFRVFVCSNPSSPSGLPKPTTNRHGLFISPRSVVFPDWRPIFNELCDINSIFIPKSVNNKKIYLGTSNGIFVSTDLGLNWLQKNQGISLTEIVHTASTPQAIVAGINGGGIIRSVDDGITWKSSNKGIASSFISTMVSDPKDPNVLFVGSTLELYKSTNGGIQWSSVFFPDTNKIVNKKYFTNDKNQMSVVISPINSKVVFMHSPAFGYHISTDGGNQWAKINPFVTDTFGLRENIQCDPVDVSTIYVGAMGLLKSTDLGAKWIDISGDIPKTIFDPIGQKQTPLFAFAPAINPDNPKEIYLPIVAGVEYLVPYKIFKTTDGGIRWDSLKVNGNFVRIEKTDPSIIMCSGERGVWYSWDAGKSWASVSYNNTLTNVLYMGISQKIKNIFEYYIGSGSGVQKLNLTNFPKYSADTIAGNFGSVLVGQNLERAIIIKNTSGQRRLAVKFEGISDTTIFQYAGPQQFYIQTDSEESLTVKLRAKTYGQKGAIMVFSTNDPLSPKIFITLRAVVLGKPPIEKFSYNFGEVLVKKDSATSFTVDNSQGFQSMELTYLRNSDSVNFNYLGLPKYVIDTGKIQSIGIKFLPKSPGAKQAIIEFSTNDPRFTSVALKFQGVGILGKIPIEKYSYDFGAILVNKDSISSFTIDNFQGFQPIALNYLGSSDSVSFNYSGPSNIIIDTGKSQSIGIIFSPKSTGAKQSIVRFSTNEPRLPILSLRLQGVGIIKNYLSRKVLFDTTYGFATVDSLQLHKYYSMLTKSLERSGISALFKTSNGLTDINSIVIANPNKAFDQKYMDSVQRFVINGGFLVVAGSSSGVSNKLLNGFLSNEGWQIKNKTKVGITLNDDRIIDSTNTLLNYNDQIIATPSIQTVYLTKIDSIILPNPSSILIDTATAVPIFKVVSKKLYSVSNSDSTNKKIPLAYVGAYSKVGKGQIVVLSDYNLWWNGLDDSTKSIGVLAGKNLQLALNIFGLIDNLNIKLPNPTPKEAYKIISIPYQLSDSSIYTIFKDLGIPNGYEWRMFGKWSDKTTSYLEFPTGFKTIKRGEGYWLITKQPKIIDFGTATVPGVEDDFEITLQPGWNLIGNPFPYKVSWQDSYKDSSVETTLHSYDKKWETVSTTMDSLTGYFLKNRASSVRKIKINSKNLSGTPQSALPKEQLANQLGNNEWQIQLTATSAKAKDENNFIGMAENAKADFDVRDVSEPPPAPENYISLAFDNPSGKLTADFRNISSEGTFWNFSVATSIQENIISLEQNKFGNIPNEFSIFIIDYTLERIFEVSDARTYQFTLRKNETNRRFRIIVGTEQFIEKNTNGIPIVPLKYSLEQNYPNPFNPSTTIRYSISHSAHVELDVYNILGQKISTLVNGFLPIGIYNIEWNGTDRIGNSVASGIYYYRLRTEEFTSVKKMTLIK